MTVRITKQTLREAADVLEALGAGLSVERQAQIEAMQTLLAFTSVLRPEDPAAGRSPRTRGSHDRKSANCELQRSIPAHAGKSHSGIRCPLASKVDPRARGEVRVSAGRHGSTRGRAPRTR